MRSLRTVVNAAIEDGLMKLEDSPFGKKKYQIPASKNIKKALMLKQIREIMDFPSLEGSAEQKYRDMWLFLYFGNGMNVTDMCRLKNENLDSNSITFVRSKTRNSTRTSQTKIKVSLIDPLKVIIEKYRNTDLNPNGYLFPFLADTETETQIRDRVQSVNKRINKHMKAIGIKLKIEMPITSYTARHSFASSLKKGNQSATIIAEFLGHKNISTTQAYLGSIEDNQQDKIMQNLIPKK
jgi:integrase